MPLQHRVLAAPIRPGADQKQAGRHWSERHAKLVPSIDHLVGYVQNRPCAHWALRMQFLVCAESWFTSQADERAAYASGYYMSTIVPDEERFIDRVHAWHASVSAIETLRSGAPCGYRAISLGGDRAVLEDSADTLTRAEVLFLRAPSPDGGAPWMLSGWTDDLDAADALATRIGGVAFTAEPCVVVAPPLSEWTY